MNLPSWHFFFFSETTLTAFADVDFFIYTLPLSGQISLFFLLLSLKFQSFSALFELSSINVKSNPC